MSARSEWVSWLNSYGAGNFYDHFVENAQGAMSQCIYCRQDIFLDIVEGGVMLIGKLKMVIMDVMVEVLMVHTCQ